MKKLIRYVLAGSLALIAVRTSAAEPTSAVELREAVVAYFEGADEPTVEAASWNPQNEFNVGIHDMGATENGFARYVCSILGKRGLPAGITVNVIDINTMGMERKKWEVIGEAKCSE